MLIDLYCERTGAGMAAEPLNAVTNLAFLAAAWAAWSLARRKGTLAPDLWALIALTIAIALGSAAFHIFATSETRLADELPILLFQLWFLWLYARDAMKMRSVSAAAAIAAYLAVAYLTRGYPGVANGSLVYAPALTVMLALGWYHYAQQKDERLLLAGAAGMLLLSLALRSVDLMVCPEFPAGTHFLWHILNAVVLYLSMRALILNRTAAHR